MNDMDPTPSLQLIHSLKKDINAVFFFFFFFFYDYILLRWIEIVIMKAVKTLHGHIHFFDIVIMKGSLIYRDSNHPHQAILNKKFDFNQKNYF
jgi:hypothetical protein